MDRKKKRKKKKNPKSSQQLCCLFSSHAEMTVELLPPSAALSAALTLGKRNGKGWEVFFPGGRESLGAGSSNSMWMVRREKRCELRSMIHRETDAELIGCRELSINRLLVIEVGRTEAGKRLMFGLQAKLMWKLWKRSKCSQRSRKVQWQDTSEVSLSKLKRLAEYML